MIKLCSIIYIPHAPVFFRYRLCIPIYASTSVCLLYSKRPLPCTMWGSIDLLIVSYSYLLPPPSFSWIASLCLYSPFCHSRCFPLQSNLSNFSLAHLEFEPQLESYSRVFCWPHAWFQYTHLDFDLWICWVCYKTCTILILLHGHFHPLCCWGLAGLYSILLYSWLLPIVLLYHLLESSS